MSRTLLDIRQQVKDDLDLNEEIFVEDSDLNRWINDAIETAEAEIHTLYEDYFLDRTVYTLTAGVRELDFPADIYASKVRKLLFKESLTSPNTAAHEVKREKNLIEAEGRDIYEYQSATPTLTWVETNNSVDGRKIRLYPEQGRAGYLVMYYIRNANRLVDDADVCDIDEFSRFIIQHTKTQAYLKDGDPRAEESKTLEEQLKAQMVATLSNRTPDNNDEIRLDLAHYEDMVGGSGIYD
jgi:hypothetical protein